MTPSSGPPLGWTVTLPGEAPDLFPSWGSGLLPSQEEVGTGGWKQFTHWRERTHRSSLISIQVKEREGKMFVSMGRKSWSSFPVMDKRHLWQSDHDISPCSSSRSRSYPYKPLRHIHPYCNAKMTVCALILHHAAVEKKKKNVNCITDLHWPNFYTTWSTLLVWKSFLIVVRGHGYVCWLLKIHIAVPHLSPSTSLASDTTEKPQGAPKSNSLSWSCPA